MAMAPTKLLSPLENEAPRAWVVRTLTDWIKQGTLRAGMPLPSERVLGKQLGASPATVQRALRILEAKGMVSELSGRTRIVTNTKPRGADPMLAESIVIIAPGPAESVVGHTQTGWSEFVTLGAVAAARQTGHPVLTIETDHGLNDRQWAGLIDSPPFGIVVTAALEESAELVTVLKRLQAAGLTIVTYGDGPDHATFDHVAHDHAAGCAQLVRWLIAQGRKRIMPTWPERGRNFYWVHERRRGYEEAMHEAGLEPLPTTWIPNSPDSTNERSKFERHTRTVAGYLIPQLMAPTPVDALLAASDGELLCLSAAVRLFGHVPNQTLLMAGYDNYSADVPENQFEPTGAAVTIDKQNITAGQELVRMLTQRRSSALPAAPQRRLMPPQLVVLNKNFAGPDAVPASSSEVLQTPIV